MEFVFIQTKWKNKNYVLYFRKIQFDQSRHLGNLGRGLRHLVLNWTVDCHRRNLLLEEPSQDRTEMSDSSSNLQTSAGYSSATT